jgi:hypothetical protein
MNGIGTTITNDTLLQYSYKLSANPTNSNNLVFSFVDKSNADYDIYAINSNNGGSSWNTPIRVSSDPINNGNNQDMLWANFSETGKYAAVWRDRRANNGAQNQPYKIWGSLSNNGGNSFSPNFQISQTDGPLMTPVDGNDFLGCVLNDTVVYSCWTDKRNNSTNQLYFNKFKLANVTGILSETVNDTGIRIYPNPNKGEFIIAFIKENDRKIEITDMNGKLIHTLNSIDKQVKINLKLIPGNYFLRVFESSKTSKLSFIIDQ